MIMNNPQNIFPKYPIRLVLTYFCMMSSRKMGIIFMTCLRCTYCMNVPGMYWSEGAGRYHM